MKKKILMAILLTAVLGLAACTSEKTSSTNINITTTTDEGTKEYNYSSENVNGEVTTESSVTETPAGDEAADELVSFCEDMDRDLTEKWDTDEGDGHDITYDPDRIYVHTWEADIRSEKDADPEYYKNSIIPSWIQATEDWRKTLDGKGLTDVGITYQYLSADQSIALFTIKDGEIVDSIF